MLLDLYTPNAKVPWGNQFWLGAVTEVTFITKKMIHSKRVAGPSF